MIRIIKDQSNTVCLTLSEKTTIEGATYLFYFKNDQTGETKYFIAPEDSINPVRINEFTIEENDTEDLENGIVSLSAGDWTYEIYEQESTSNLDPEETGSLVENGKVQVIGEQGSTPTFTPEETVTPVFDGEV